MADEVLRLEVWEGDWQLPSVDPDCLSALAYCKFSGVPVKVMRTNNPWKSPSGRLPVMKHKEVTETSVTNIFSYLRKQNWGCDFNLSTKQCADVVAFHAMLEQLLLPSILHTWWIDRETYGDVTRPWFTRASPFPFNFTLARKWSKLAADRVYVVHGNDNITEKDVELKIFNDAKICLNHLSHKLGDQDFFFGNMPSSLDALVFGYLGPLLKAPLNSNPLLNHLRSCDNLTLHTSRILRLYFPPSLQDMDEKQKSEQKKKESETDSMEFPNKRRNMVLAGVFAAVSMVVYAFVSGLVQVQFQDDGDDDDDER